MYFIVSSYRTRSTAVQKGHTVKGTITKESGILPMETHTDQIVQTLIARESEAIKIKFICRKFVKRREIETTKHLGTNIQVQDEENHHFLFLLIF